MGIDISLIQKRKSNGHSQDLAILLDYWKQRCLLAEKCLEESPCDPDITLEQIQAHNNYNIFLDKNGKLQ